MNLAGIPPLSGFIGKLGLMRAGVADGSVWAWLLVTGSAVTSLFTLYVMAKVWNLAFWRAAPPGRPRPAPSWSPTPKRTTTTSTRAPTTSPAAATNRSAPATSQPGSRSRPPCTDTPSPPRRNCRCR